MGKIIAISNQKGGTGKTTTTVNLGIGLANEGKKVLLIDYDAQGSLTQCLGYPNPDELSVTISNLMEKSINEQPTEHGEGILHHSEGVDFIPANIELSGMETFLVNTMSRERVLKNYLSQIKDNYDYVLIDCTPSLGMLTINALTAANEVIIPVQSHFLPAKVSQTFPLQLRTRQPKRQAQQTQTARLHCLLNHRAAAHLPAVVVAAAAVAATLLPASQILP